jgi:hypothetical protein
MGFFSFTCAKSHLPVMASTSWGEDDFSRVHLLTRDGGIMQGQYDGYGRLEMNDGGTLEDLDEPILAGKWKLVLSKFYRGEKFDELDRSFHEPGQGHFHDSDLLAKWFAQGGFPTYQDYVDAYFRKA